MSRVASHARTTTGAEVVVRIVVVVALAIDAVVHLRLAPAYQVAAPGGIGGGTLFRVQAAAAILAAIFLLVRGSALAYAVAGLVALSALVPVVLYTYVDVPPLGPVPAMYEPVWHLEKVISAVAEAIAVLLSVVGLVASRGRRAARRTA